jgi:hypothetical protein
MTFDFPTFLVAATVLTGGSGSSMRSLRPSAPALVLRSFVVEPFRIPVRLHDADAAGGRLHPGEQVLLRPALAGAEQQVPPLGEPERGDVVVFRFPQNESIDYIKRSSACPATRSTTATRPCT